MAINKLFFGNINIKAAKLGSSDVKIYLGNTLVYESGTTTTT